MQLLKKIQHEGCLVTSFAMALGVSTEEMMTRIGHAGHVTVDKLRMGYHINECILVAMDLGRTVTPFELAPALEFNGVQYVLPYTRDRFEHYIQHCAGVVTGRGRKYDHACGFTRGWILDPDKPELYQYSKAACEERGFYTQCLWIIK